MNASMGEDLPDSSDSDVMEEYLDYDDDEDFTSDEDEDDDDEDFW